MVRLSKKQNKNGNLLRKIINKMIEQKNEAIEWRNESNKNLKYFLIIAVLVVIIMPIWLAYSIVDTKNNLGLMLYYPVQGIITIIFMFFARIGVNKDKLEKFDIVYSAIIDILFSGVVAYALVMAQAGVFNIEAPAVSAIALFFAPQKIFYILLKAKNKWQKT